MNNQQRIAVRQALRILGGTHFYKRRSDYEQVMHQIMGLLQLANHQLTPQGLYPKDLDLIWRASLELCSEHALNQIRGAA